MLQENDLSRVVPLEVHGDDAESHRRRSFLVVSLRSPITKGATMRTLFPMYIMDSDQTGSGTAPRLQFCNIGIRGNFDPYTRI